MFIILIGRRLSRVLSLATLVLLIAIVVCSTWPHCQPNTREITSPGGVPGRGRVVVHFIDVGDGSAVLIKSADTTVLLDAGGVFAGEVVVEYLRSQRVDAVDYLILTFPRPEHAGGMLTVLHSVAVTEFLPPAVDTSDWVYQHARQLVDYYQVTVRQVSRDTVLQLGPGTDLRPLGPFAEIFAEGQFSPGDQSLPWLLSVGNIRFLFASDLTTSGEHMLLRVVSDLKADVLMIAGHGSRESTSTVFLEALEPCRDLNRRE